MEIVLGLINLLIVVYSLPLGLASITYFGLTNGLLNETLTIDLFILAVIVVVGLVNFNDLIYLTQPALIFDYYTQHGLWRLINYQLTNWSAIMLHSSLGLVLLVPLFIRISYAIFTSTKIFHSSANSSLAAVLGCIPECRRSLLTISDRNNAVTFSEVATQKSPQANLAQTILNNSPPSKSVAIMDAELNQHCLLVGTTGSGKTSTMLHFVESMAERNFPVVYLDGKGSPDLIDKLKAIAVKNGRVFKVFTLRPGIHSDLSNLAGYNPFGSGTATEWKNRIMSLFAQAQSRGQEHFSLGEQNYINFVANILYSWGKPVDLRIILALLEQPNKLLELAQKVNPYIALKLTQLHNSDIGRAVGDVVKLLELFVYSDYGYLFNTTELDNVIKIRQSILDNEIILFLFDASSYPEDTRKVAKMVINDINSSFAEFGKFTQALCIFDEFASYASENLAETISLHRSNGMHAIVGTQSITTVKLKSEDTKRIAEELIACCNTFIIHRINHVEDAEILAKVIGTHKTYDVTSYIGEDNNSTTTKTLKMVDALKIDPQILKELQTGEAVIYRKALDKTVAANKSIANLVKVKIRP